MAAWAIHYGPSGGPHVALDFGPPARPGSVQPRYVTPPIRQDRRPSNPRDRLREMKQLLIDRFGHFHLGADAFANYDADGRQAIRRAIPIPPRAGPWPGHPPAGQAPRQTLWRIGEPGWLPKMLPRGGRKSQAKMMANRVGKLLKNDFRPARFKFRKRLGYGGFGAAFLFEMLSEDDMVIPIVVKADISMRRRSRDMPNEKENFVIMAGAQHFVQRLVLQDIPLPAKKKSTMDKLSGLFSRLTTKVREPNPPGYSDNDDDEDEGVELADMYTPADYIRTARRTLDRRANIIIMEYMSRGNLHNLITKLKKNDRLSDRMLWLIFECLFKACIAMAHPLRFCPPDKDPWNDFVTPRDEFAPDRDTLPESPMVHFDIDPQNALVGDFGLPDEGHNFVPIVKIADPGLSQIVDRRFRRDEWKVWSFRTCGKPEFFTPEQFTPEWDHEASRGLYDLSLQETAGNYQWWSNLYQVGWIMWCLMVKCMPPTPPVASPYSYPAEDRSNATIRGFSYGLHIYANDFRAFDRRLKHLIARCLDHDPTKRPRMRYMEQVIAANIGRMDLRDQESDEELMRNARRIFGEPP